MRHAIALLALALAPVRAAPHSLKAVPPAADLAIVDVYFEDYDRTVVKRQDLPAGESIYVTFRIAGFRADDQHRIRLTYWLDCLDPQKAPLTETFTRSIETALAVEDERWRPKVDWSLVIPSFAPTGEYQVAIRVRDEIAQKEVRQAVPFHVRGVQMAPADKLEVRDFEFADSEQGQAKAEPVFSPGSTLWARFRVVGFKVSAEKELAVEEDLSVLNAEGKVLFTRPNSAVEKYHMFYPPRFLPAAFNLDLQADVKAAEYIIRLDIRDLLGKQEARFEAKFKIQ
jgi:hypothetical protein